MAIIDSLFLKLGYDYDPSKLEKFNNIVSTSGNVIRSLSFAAIGAITSIALLTVRSSKLALEQTRMGKNIDVSRSSIEAFSRVSKDLTGSGGAATELLGTLGDMNDAYKAGEDVSDKYIQGLARLGIDFQSFMQLNPDDQVIKMASAFQAVDKDTQAASRSLLGLSRDQQTFLRGFKEEDYLAAKPTEANIKAAEKLDKMYRKFQSTAQDAANAIGSKVLGPATDVLELFIEELPRIIEFAGELTDAFFAFGKGLGIVYAQLEQFFKKTKKGITDFFTDNVLTRFGAKLGGFTADVVGKTASPNIEQNNDINIEVNSTAPAETVGNEIVSKIELNIRRLAEQNYSGVIA